jgi:hypothetical protein
MKTPSASTPLNPPDTPIPLRRERGAPAVEKEAQKLPEKEALYVRLTFFLPRRAVRRVETHRTFQYPSTSSTPLSGRGSRRSVLAVVRIHALAVPPVWSPWTALSQSVRIALCEQQDTRTHTQALALLPAFLPLFLLKDDGEPVRPVILASACACSLTRELLFLWSLAHGNFERDHHRAVAPRTVRSGPRRDVFSRAQCGCSSSRSSTLKRRVNGFVHHSSPLPLPRRVGPVSFAKTCARVLTRAAACVRGDLEIANASASSTGSGLLCSCTWHGAQASLAVHNSANVILVSKQ